MKNQNTVFEQLMNYANNMQIIDTHEHLNIEKNYVGDKPDILCDYFSHYISSDLMSAGMSEKELEKIRNTGVDINERFVMFEPWLSQVKNTSYYRSLEISAKIIHGADEISRSTIEELNAKLIKAASQKDYGRYIMKDLCNIEISINDNWSDDMHASTNDLFVPAWQPNDYLYYTDCDYPENPQVPKLSLDNVSLGEFCEHFIKHLENQIKTGAKALKIPVAYSRSLYFEDVDYNEAKVIFNDVAKSKASFPKKLQDYIMHYILKTAGENDIPVQIHTGIQEGMGHDLEDSNPMLLKNLFGKYPDVTFDLFHTGYPYERELAVLVKYYPNVYVDFCWSHIISPFAARNAFYEMLDLLPYTKIFGFGGDYIFYDGVVGHLTIAKQNICTVLAQKVGNGELSYDLAEKILQSVLYDNAKRIFKL